MRSLMRYLNSLSDHLAKLLNRFADDAVLLDTPMQLLQRAVRGQIPPQEFGKRLVGLAQKYDVTFREMLHHLGNIYNDKRVTGFDLQMYKALIGAYMNCHHEALRRKPPCA